MAKNLNVFTGPVHALYASDFKIVKNKLVRNIKDEILIEKASFYPIYGGFVNMEYNCPLADLEEAYSYVNDSISRREQKIMRYLTDTTIPEEERMEYFKKVESFSSIVFYNPSEVEYGFSLPKDEFKIYKQKVLINKNKK